MDERIVPAIVLLLNFLFGLLAGFIPDLFPMVGVLNFITALMLVVLALMVYENAKKIDFIEEHVWRRLNEIDERIKLNRNFMEDLKKQMDKN
jgi:sulfite exporter TauE/SafE